MNRQYNIKRFETLMQAVERPGVDALMNYIRKSDFYTAPASTRFHLSCEGGLLQHSLNVFDALAMRMEIIEDSKETDGLALDRYVYKVAGEPVAEFPKSTLVIAALLHDICKTNFYKTEMRNQKTYDPEKVKAAEGWQIKKDNGGRFIWEQVPAYAVEDKNPYGHGEKSVMMVEEFMKLSMEERYAIRWHMGMGDCTYSQIQAFNQSCEKYPLVLLLHNADQEASHFMEQPDGNRKAFSDPVCKEDDADAGMEFEDAEAL